MEYRERTVELSLSDEFLQTMGKEEYRVLGYLISWAIQGERRKHVTLHSSRDGELLATYREKPGGDVTYVIGGVKHADGTWSTHS